MSTERPHDLPASPEVSDEITDEQAQFMIRMAEAQYRGRYAALNAALIRAAEEQGIEIVTYTASNVEPQDFFIPLPPRI